MKKLAILSTIVLSFAIVSCKNEEKHEDAKVSVEQGIDQMTKALDTTPVATAPMDTTKK